MNRLEPRSGDLPAQLFERALGRIAETRIPAAIYRLQVHAGFPFTRAIEVVGYLNELGISDLYTSPYLRAGPGSTHGYDVTGHNEINPELGGAKGLMELSSALRAHGMSHILDFVPNHMGLGETNVWWLDVLENGPSSLFARFFDIDWSPVKDELENKVLLPILGDQYGAVLEAGELLLELSAGTFWVRYYDERLPVNPRQYPMVLRHKLQELESKIPEAIELQELLSICTACDNLPHRAEKDPERITQRHREKEVIKRRLDALLTASAEVRAHVEQAVADFNGKPGEVRSFDDLDALLDSQAYRLAHWRVAGEEINYRRFFDINALAAIRMEDPVVFRETHRLVFQLFESGVVAGLRIDHPDGLFEPRVYFERLQEEYLVATCKAELKQLAADVPFEEVEAALRERWQLEPHGPGSLFFRPLYVVVEKILGRGERLPETWAIHGTTGYDFLNQLNGLFVERDNQKAFEEIHSRFTGLKLNLEELVYDKKKLIMSSSMSSEINVLARQLNRISEMNRRSRDFTLNSLRSALVEYVASFPVYRTYVDESGVDDRDRRYIELAIGRARRRSPTTNASIFDFLRDILLLRYGAHLGPEERKKRLDFAMKLQQLTGPVMAKAMEDTAFYVYNRLVSLNEVGGEPAHFGRTVQEFHGTNAERLARFPGSLLATSTHDTKRSEDVRARINVLSELPEEWKALVSALSRAARKHRTRIAEDRAAPDRNEEMLLYQTLVGTWPFGDLGPTEYESYAGRIEGYLLKAAREAKVNTSWINPDPAWDDALARFVQGVLVDPEFVSVLGPFQKRISELGIVNSLAQVVLKIASPGVPDVYQGCETWDFSLVDPDNRRPVDFQALAATLRRLAERIEEGPESRQALCRELWESRADGSVKLYVTWRGLRMRRLLPELFTSGEYVPVETAGPRSAHLVALSRRRGFSQALAVVPRLLARLPQEQGGWEGTFVLLPQGSGSAGWVDVFSGAVHRPVAHRGQPALPAAALFASLPVALLQPAA